MSEPTGYQCRICEGDMVPEHGGDAGHSAWMECISCGNTEQLNLMLQERLVDSPMRRGRDGLRRQLAAANERAGRLEAEKEELRQAWCKWQTPTTTDLANHAEATFERILGGA